MVIQVCLDLNHVYHSIERIKELMSCYRTMMDELQFLCSWACVACLNCRQLINFNDIFVPSTEKPLHISMDTFLHLSSLYNITLERMFLEKQ